MSFLRYLLVLISLLAVLAQQTPKLVFVQ
jgi:lysosomal acid phosphatase